MRTYSLTHLADRELLRDLAASVQQESSTTAVVLAHIGEVDARKLYLPAGYSSMFAYCVRELHLSEDSAFKRIRAGRTARQFPALFTALEEGRVHLSGIVLLAAHLTPENSEELIGSAAHKTKAEIELLLAQRFPRAELLPMVHELPARAAQENNELAPAQLESHASKFGNRQQAPGPVGASAPRPKVAPSSAESFALQMTIARETHEKLRYAEALLSHKIPPGDLAQVLDRVLDLAIRHLEKQKFAATEKPRTGSRRVTTSKRHVPAHVKRAVWERDQGRCTFTSESGHRCKSRTFLQFDHIDPVARGGAATVQNLRLRCSTHNQLEAQRVFGAGFMAEKREAAQRAARESHKCKAETDHDLVACLRSLKFRADEARSAVAHCEGMTDSSLEDRVRRALSHLKPRARCIKPATQRAQAP